MGVFILALNEISAQGCNMMGAIGKMFVHNVRS